ncbi:MAG: DUF805 domain-containing protein [Alphaproteobacteria bacterium]|nr:DUF805 domain-containing protein [Alphaproteobacteria bacterium]
MIDLKHLLFSFSGRIGRQYWWLTSLAVAFISGMANAVIEVAAKTSGHGAFDPEAQEFVPSWPYIVGILALGLVNVWISYAVAAKRLHDRDRTGWWAIVPWLVMIPGIAAMVGASSLPEDLSTLMFAVGAGIALVAIAMGIWLLIELGFLKGTAGPNRFGPDPLPPKPEGDAAPKPAAS